MKHYTHKLTALLLAALIMVSPVAQYACAEEAVYHTETKYPLLADVRDQLDEDEIVAAYDVVIDMGDYFNPADVSAFKVEKTNQSTDKVEVSFFSAHATDGAAFTSDMPGSYFAYYVARPVSGHPAYEVSRRITVNTVEEPAAPVVSEAVETFPEDEPADEDSEDDPYEESEIDDSEEAAFEDEGEPEEEYDDAEKFPQEGDADCTNQLTTMTTGADGSASCTIPREYTRLYLKELQAPTGYRLSKTVYIVDMPDGDSVTALIKNDQQRAGLKITKRGEVLTGADVTGAGVRFIYEIRKLSGAVYRVTAESAIYTPDGALMYQKGDVVADGLTTGDSGEVTLNDVPLGSYVVEETQAPAGFVLSGEKHTVKLEYAGQDAEVAFNETTFTNERQKAAVTIHKQDCETKNPVVGGTFALYSASAITSYKGDNLVSAGSLIETVKTGADGNATFAADLPVGFRYEVREVAPPAGYTFGVDKYEFAFSAPAQTQAVSEFGYTFSNDRITATLNLHKKDAETGYEQGDAQLAGAVYALYAREAIVHPDGKTGTLYEKDALVTTMTTDAVGDAKAENLPLGRYYLKEITPSAGYLLDANEYDVDCTKYDPTKYLILVEATVKEQVIKQPFQIILTINVFPAKPEQIADSKRRTGRHDDQGIVPVLSPKQEIVGEVLKLLLVADRFSCSSHDMNAPLRVTFLRTPQAKEPM